MSPPFKRAKERVAWGRSGRNRTSFCIHLRGQVKAQAVGVHVARPVLLSPPTHPLRLRAGAHAQTCAGE